MIRAVAVRSGERLASKSVPKFVRFRGYNDYGYPTVTASIDYHHAGRGWHPCASSASASSYRCPCILVAVASDIMWSGRA